MKEKIIDLFYFLLLLAGIVAGIYGIGYEITILKWIGAVIVFGIPIVIALIHRITD